MALAIRARGRGPAPVWEGDRWGLRAEAEALVEGEAGELDAVAAALGPAVCERLSAGLLLLRFGNAVGTVEAGPLGRLELRSGKLDGAGFDALLSQLAMRAAALPFADEAVGSRAYERGELGEDVLYHAFVYLRGALSEAAPPEEALLPALVGVLRAPHERLARVEVDVPLGAAQRIGASALFDLAAGRWPLVRAAGGGPVARALGGRLPAVVRESAVERSVDTAENRFVRAFLGLCEGVLRGMEGLARAETPLRAAVEALRRRLAPVLLHPLWRSVGPLSHLPVGSTVLQRDARYKVIFTHHQRLMLGARLPPPAAPAAGLMGLKDLATLYELWCCFGLIDAVSAALGPPSALGLVHRDAFAVRLKPDDYEARWPDGTRLRYAPRMPGGRPGQGSYSIPLKPDLALQVPAGRPGAGLHIFDAKFRVDWGGGPDGGGRGGRVKPADLLKMHAYRDALQARSAWALFPGDRDAHHPAPTALPAAPDGPPIDGVGAFALGLGGGSAALHRYIARLCGP